MRTNRWIPTIVLFFALGLTLGANPPGDFEYFPGAVYDPQVPTLEKVVGHVWGEEVSSHAQIEAYVKALAAASDKVEYLNYGKSWEGRNLYVLIVSDPKNLARLEQIRQANHDMAFPSSSARIPADQPATVWLAYGIHGNEISSPEAGLLAAYHLAAAQNDPLARKILENCIVLIDPTQNPDGKDRFVNYFRQSRGRWPNPDPDSAEHNETWPGGRTNHYFFDMNRDWFAMTQQETRGRIGLYLQWYPQVVVDLHEMGGNATYYFAPPASPLNPVFTPAQVDWLHRFGKNNAAWFDRFRLDYFTRQVFDSFYPGYGEGWPMFQGAIGMTYEQASVRGLVLDRDDGTRLYFRETVRHHFLASLSTLETAAENREQLVKGFQEFRRSAVEEAKKLPIKAYLFPPTSDQGRTAEMVNLLMSQGIQVKTANAPFSAAKARGLISGETGARDFPKGTFVVSLDQPTGRLAQTLLAPNTPMDDEFLAEQEKRRARREREEFYDVTAWALPLLWNVEAYAAESEVNAPLTTLSAPVPTENGVSVEKAELAYLVPWGTSAAGRLLAALVREDIRVHTSDEPFTIQGRELPAGSLIVKTKDNPENLYDRIRELARTTGAEVLPTNSAWVESGVNFGSNDVHLVKKPRVAIAYGSPTGSASTGAIQYIFDRVFEYPTSAVYVEDLGSADLSRYNVIIFPDVWGRGGYTDVLGERGLERIKNWMREGGTLITLAGASEWAAQEKVGLLQTKTEMKQKADKAADGEKGEKKDDKSASAASTLEEMIQPAQEPPDSVPGALLHVVLDTEHWLAFGYPADLPALVESRRIFTPLTLDKGINVGTYAESDKLVLGGFIWEDSRRQLANKAFLMHQRAGRGNLVAFAEDPSYRGFLVGQYLLLENAVFFGPAH